MRDRRWLHLFWRIPIILVLVMCADLVLSAGIRQYQRTRAEDNVVQSEMAQEPYKSSDWGRAYWEELGQYEGLWRPYVMFRAGPIQGRYINVVDGVRRTYQPRIVSNAQRPVVFVFGGSAAWGHGVRDDETLASWIARVGEERGVQLDVRNYAESAWVNWQGIAYLTELLADGYRPDVVVFYSGVNEILSGRRWANQRRPIWDGDVYQQAMTTLGQERHRPLTRAFQFYTRTSFLWSRFSGGYPESELPPPAPQVIGPKVGAEYGADQALVENLGKAYGFTTLFVWQLTVADKAVMTPQEQTYAGWLPRTPETTPAVEWWSLPLNLKQEYEQAEAEAVRRGALKLTGAFDGMQETAFIDWMHPAGSGNERVARALYPHLAPGLTVPKPPLLITQSLASITASPAVSTGTGRLKTTIRWATRDGSSAEVWLSINGGAEMLFAGISPHGAQDAEWIEAGNVYDFRLYAGQEHKVLLSRVFVSRLGSDAPGAR